MVAAPPAVVVPPLSRQCAPLTCSVYLLDPRLVNVQDWFAPPEAAQICRWVPLAVLPLVSSRREPVAHPGVNVWAPLLIVPVVVPVVPPVVVPVVPPVFV